MTGTDRKTKLTLPGDLIAPCGMNCRLCHGFNRERNTCPGCRRIDTPARRKSDYRKRCKIRNCEQFAEGRMRYCADRCGDFPCTRLKQLDKRYRARYGMSMLDNLRMIDESGIRHFIRNEKEKWTCPGCGQLLCVHKPVCLNCGHKWNSGLYRMENMNTKALSRK